MRNLYQISLQDCQSYYARRFRHFHQEIVAFRTIFMIRTHTYQTLFSTSGHRFSQNLTSEASQSELKERELHHHGLDRSSGYHHYKVLQYLSSQTPPYNYLNHQLLEKIVIIKVAKKFVPALSIYSCPLRGKRDGLVKKEETR